MIGFSALGCGKHHTLITSVAQVGQFGPYPTPPNPTLPLPLPLPLHYPYTTLPYPTLPLHYPTLPYPTLPPLPSPTPHPYPLGKPSFSKEILSWMESFDLSNRYCVGVFHSVTFNHKVQCSRVWLEVKIYDTPAGGIRASQGTISSLECFNFCILGFVYGAKESKKPRMFIDDVNL